MQYLLLAHIDQDLPGPPGKAEFDSRMRHGLNHAAALKTGGSPRASQKRRGCIEVRPVRDRAAVRARGCA